jgi:uncharacterized protein with HEPN domain
MAYEQLQDAVIRDVEVIGEAAKRLPPIFGTLYADRRRRSVRNMEGSLKQESSSLVLQWEGLRAC